MKIALIVGAIAAIGIAVALALVFTVGKKKGGSSSAGAASPTASVGPNGGVGSSGTTGKTGSLITLEDGSTFTYENNFGGEWAADPKKPFAGGGKAQEWSPRVSEEWVWGEHVIRGVNLG